MAEWFERHADADVACGHAWVIDEVGNRVRRVWSEPFERYPVATGAHVQIQPATFIRTEAFRRSGGFDANDLGNWDGGLLTSLFLSGAHIETVDAFLGAYRLHSDSITMSGKLAERHYANARANFERLMGRPWDARDDRAAKLHRMAKHMRTRCARGSGLRRVRCSGRASIARDPAMEGAQVVAGLASKDVGPLLAALCAIHRPL